MKIEKLPSGSYRIRKMYKGQTYTVIFDYKPTQKEAMQAMAAELDKVEGDILNINKAKVQNEDGKWITKTTKTVTSTRKIIIPAELADKIRKQGYVYRGHPNSITCFLFKTQDALGIPRFSIHKLRHYFASEMSALGIPEADIMRMGGWETDHVMKSVYRHSMIEKEEKAKREAAEKFQRTIFS